MISKISSTNKPPWWTNRLAKTIEQKQPLYSTFRHTHLSSDYAAYSQLPVKNEIKSQIRSAQAKYNKQLIDNLQTDPIPLFEFIRNKSSLESMIMDRPTCQS